MLYNNTKILLADDDPDILTFVGYNLKKEGETLSCIFASFPCKEVVNYNYLCSYPMIGWQLLNDFS